jgi:hypothetical protein
MHDLLFDNQGDLSEGSLLRYAQSTGADPEEVSRLITEGSPRQRVEDDVAGGTHTRLGR